MRKQWYEVASFDGHESSVEPYEEYCVVPDWYNLSTEISEGTRGMFYNLHDTIVCAYTQFDELVELMLEKPYLERSKIKANPCVSHNTMYYCDLQGMVTKFSIKGA